MPNQLPDCFCCGKDNVLTGSKKTKLDACHFCQKWGCGDCVFKNFPFPLPEQLAGDQTLIGRICRLCETKFYIKNKLDEIFRKIDAKERDAEVL